MKKGLILLTSAIFLAASSFAYGEAYIGVSAGVTDYGSGFDKGTSFGVRAGYKFFDYLAIEAGYTDYGDTEWDYYPGIEVGAKGGNLSAIALFPITERFDIYAKAGVDYLEASGNTGLGFSVTVDETEFAYGGGINIGFTESIGMFVEYGGNTENISAGLKFSFGGAKKAESPRMEPYNTYRPSEPTQQSTPPVTYGAASQLRAVNAADKGDCRFIKSVTRGAGGSGDVSKYIEDAMNAALTEAANNGADSYFVVNTETTDSGATVVLEALRCN